MAVLKLLINFGHIFYASVESTMITFPTFVKLMVLPLPNCGWWRSESAHFRLPMLNNRPSTTLDMET